MIENMTFQVASFDSKEDFLAAMAGHRYSDEPEYHAREATLNPVLGTETRDALRRLPEPEILPLHNLRPRNAFRFARDLQPGDHVIYDGDRAVVRSTAEHHGNRELVLRFSFGSRLVECRPTYLIAIP